MYFGHLYMLKAFLGSLKFISVARDIFWSLLGWSTFIPFIKFEGYGFYADVHVVLGETADKAIWEVLRPCNEYWIQSMMTRYGNASIIRQYSDDSRMRWEKPLSFIYWNPRAVRQKILKWLICSSGSSLCSIFNSVMLFVKSDLSYFIPLLSM